MQSSNVLDHKYFRVWSLVGIFSADVLPVSKLVLIGDLMSAKQNLSQNYTSLLGFTHFPRVFHLYAVYK